MEKGNTYAPVVEEPDGKRQLVGLRRD
jgi:hypothetical protein